MTVTIKFRIALIDSVASLPVDGLHTVSLRGPNSDKAGSDGHAQSTSGDVAVIEVHLSGITGFFREIVDSTQIYIQNQDIYHFYRKSADSLYISRNCAQQLMNLWECARSLHK